ncbi:uncharacterized protein LOC123221628 isoform X2 [Mangifera indica]|uniref:uncharacterized protein LOC123221628 isoform X2 n=1 Tax=Mangifera indica TaxID=29780 RepID=UPI001CFB4BE5|nr:uncharacterized protein LOC123221628 isoform X2 [Mangifera indica]
MENGHGENLLDKLSGLALNDSNNNSSSNNNNDNLYQVMKAVEAAEATIKQQIEENTQLRTELYRKIQELERYKLEGSVAQRSHGDPWKENLHGHNEFHQSVPPGSSVDGIRSNSNTSVVDPSGLLVPHHDLKPNVDGAALLSHSQSSSISHKNNGMLKVHSSRQVNSDIVGPSQLSSPSTASFSPTRYQIDGEYDQQYNLPGQGLMPAAEVNNPGSHWKQELFLKVREQEEEILRLRRHLAEYTIKEAQIRNEKYVLEKRIAYMRLAFDQQQQELVDAASKALSYRQDIIEENIHLTYQLQAAQEERSTFVQSLLPLLVDYSLQPPVLDAQSIVSNVKVLFKHLQEKLLLTESKLKESQYQLAPWRTDMNQSNVAPRSPTHSTGAALNKNGLELVPQPAYSQGMVPTTADAPTPTDWDLMGQNRGAVGGIIGKSLDDVRYSPIARRTSSSQDIPMTFSSAQADAHAHVAQYEETANKQVNFVDPINSNELDNQYAEERQSERDQPSNWTTGNSPYTTTVDHYLPPVLEEPSSSFSEPEDDPLPAIEALQISGEAFPGRQLQACGFSINGTTSCNFEWVRHLEDGSVNYIEGAKQPNYLVTADDVDTYLAIEVQPLDERKRKGELVKVFANEHSKITCDPEMQNHIEKTLYSGHVSYQVSLSTRYLDIWEPATLTIKKDGYTIKCSGPTGIVITEKFSSSTNVAISMQSAVEFIITDSGNDGQFLRADNSSTDVSCFRDTIVLTLRLFIRRAVERRKGKKRGLFFYK